MKRFFLFLVLVGVSKLIFSQGCCSGSSSSPIAGGAASGVLLHNQLEVATSYQYYHTSLFKTNNNADSSSILNDTLSTEYLFLRSDYGLSDKLTISLALGYFLNKSLINESESYSSSGFSDLILFPRYNIANWKRQNHRTEMTIGLGLKFPLGNHKDSTLQFSSPIIGDIYTYNPPSVQLSNGSIDVVLYTFFFRTYPKRKLRIFANSLYVKKSDNSLGVKFGDYSSLSIYIGKTIYKKIGLTTQLKYETIGHTKSSNSLDLIKYNIEEQNTGSRKLLFIPQLSYSHGDFSYFITGDIPLYEDLNGTQFAIQHLFTVGVSYRILTKQSKIEGILDLN